MNIYEARYDLSPSAVVSTLSLVRSNWRQSRLRQIVAVVDSTLSSKLNEYVQLGQRCRKRVTFVAECRTFFRHSVDFVEYDKIDRVELDRVASVNRD